MIQVLLITQSDCIGCEIMTDIILSIKKTYDDNKNININISITFLGTIPFIQIQKEIDNIINK